jgi:Schlafen, AlbA_2
MYETEVRTEPAKPRLLSQLLKKEPSMSIFVKPFYQIDKVDIDALIENQIRELRQIEYKSQLPGTADSAKVEFLYDVSSFANGIGGDILYGVEEEGGVAIAATGLHATDADEAMLRLNSMLQDGVRPRIPGTQVRSIDEFKNGPIVIIRIPQSFCAPHMVTLKGRQRFYTRSTNGKYRMDIDEIQRACVSADELPQRIAAFRDERLARIIANDGSFPLAAGGKAVLHVIPFQALTRKHSLDFRLLKEKQGSFLPGIGGFHVRFNVDGLFSSSGPRGDKKELWDYSQVYRSGIVEFVDGHHLIGHTDLPTFVFEQEMIRAVSSVLEGLTELGVVPPYAIMLSLVSVKGYTLAVSSQVRAPWRDQTPIDRDHLRLPDVIVENEMPDASQFLRPIFDAIWNAGGYERCMNYDKEGQWRTRD